MKRFLTALAGLIALSCLSPAIAQEQPTRCLTVDERIDKLKAEASDATPIVIGHEAGLILVARLERMGGDALPFPADQLIGVLIVVFPQSHPNAAYIGLVQAEGVCRAAIIPAAALRELIKGA